MSTPDAAPTRSKAGRLHLATRPGVVRHALACAVVVGFVLIAINHGDAILRGDISGGRLAKVGLSVIVPSLVSMHSTVGAMRIAAHAHAARTRGTLGPDSPPVMNIERWFNTV